MRQPCVHGCHPKGGNAARHRVHENATPPRAHTPALSNKTPLALRMCTVLWPACTHANISRTWPGELDHSTACQRLSAVAPCAWPTTTRRHTHTHTSGMSNMHCRETGNDASTPQHIDPKVQLPHRPQAYTNHAKHIRATLRRRIGQNCRHTHACNTAMHENWLLHQRGKGADAEHIASGSSTWQTRSRVQQQNATASW